MPHKITRSLTPPGRKRTVSGWKPVKVALPLILATSCGLLALQPELRLAVPMLIGVTALMAALLAFALYWGEREKVLWSPVVILAVALALRLMFLFAPPQLSDDIYRYMWDGSNLLRGVNPYAAAPAEISPLTLHL